LVVRKTSCRHSSLYSTEKGALPLLRTKLHRPSQSGWRPDLVGQPAICDFHSEVWRV